MPYTMASPNPVPRSPLVVKNGSRQRRRVSSSMPIPVSLTSSNTWRVGGAGGGGARHARAHFEHAAVRHRIDGIEDEIGQCIADLIVGATHIEQIGCRRKFELNHDPPLLRRI